MNELLATIVFEQTWDAIHKTDENGDRKYRYIIHEGSSRSSKTYSIIDIFDIYARKNKGKRLTVWRDTKTDCKKTVLNDIRKHLSLTDRWEKSFKFNKTESILTYTNNSSYEIHGTDDEHTVHGLTQDAAWLNEPYKISEATFDQIDQRTSDFIIVDWNPKMSHPWIERLKKNSRTIVIHSTFLDNPFCPIESRNKILSYKGVDFSEAVLSGKKTAFQIREGDYDGLTKEEIEEVVFCLENELTGTASDYNWQVYGLGVKAEMPNRIFNWKPISLHEYRNITDENMMYGVDWGTVDPFAIVEVKYYDGALYIKELNYLSENELRSNMTSAQLQSIQHNEDGMISELFNKLGIEKRRVAVCDNNRPNKIRALRRAGWEYAIAAIKGKINDGISLLLEMPVYYTSDSINIQMEQENYSWQVDRYGIQIDKAVDTFNHTIDAIRYVAEYLRQNGIIRKI